MLRISVDETPGMAESPDPATHVARVEYELLFDGDSSYVKTPVAYDGSHPITLEAWVTVEDVWHYHHIVSNYDKGGGISLQLDRDGRSIFKLRLSDQPSPTATSTRAVPSGRHHVALVFENDQPALFVDGLRQATDRFPQDEEYQVSGEPFSIGASTIGTDAPRLPFHGAIDEVRISRTARYRNDFVPAKRFEPDEHTMALYHFDEGTGDIAHDASGNGHHARIVDAQWVRVGYKRPLSGIVAASAEIPGIGPWQIATRYPSSEVRSVAWSPDGALIACGTQVGWVRVYDARTLELVRLVAGDQGGTSLLAWSPDGHWLARGASNHRDIGV